MKLHTLYDQLPMSFTLSNKFPSPSDYLNNTPSQIQSIQIHHRIRPPNVPRFNDPRRQLVQREPPHRGQSRRLEFARLPNCARARARVSPPSAQQPAAFSRAGKKSASGTKS